MLVLLNAHFNPPYPSTHAPPPPPPPTHRERERERDRERERGRALLHRKLLNNIVTYKEFEICSVKKGLKSSLSCIIQSYHMHNQSVENAGVAFGKGADERNELFGKK